MHSGYEQKRISVVNCVEHVRRMRGESRADLMRSANGRHYVVKRLNNPQGRRILVNEYVSNVVLKLLRIDTPPIAAVTISTPELNGASEMHFGSQHPGSPDSLAIYDFLPDTLLANLANRRDFCGALVFDKWLANADGRQCIFFQSQLDRAPYCGEQGVGWVAQMIDNGLVFGGDRWAFSDSPVQGIYCRTIVYGKKARLRDFEPWLERAMTIDRSEVEEALVSMPPGWIQGEEYLFADLLRRLWRRRERLPILIAETISWLNSAKRRKNGHFRNWRRECHARQCDLTGSAPPEIPYGKSFLG
jgi:hypothetical protein